MKVDVILVTYGEPPLPVFSDQWDFSKRILRKLTRLVAPIPHAVIPLLGALRGIKRVRQWKQEGFTSPLEAITQAQADVLSPLLCELFPEHEWRVTPAYEFRDPTLAQRLDERIQNGTERLVIVPLYVLHSDFTDGITARDLRTYQAQAKQPLPPTTLLSFRPHLDTLAEIMAGYIRTQVRALGLTPEACRETALLCGCHGTVIHPPKGIEDTGYEDTYGLFCRIEAQLRDEFGPIAIGWLNHRLGGDWTSPTLEQSAKAVQAEGIRSVVYYPFGFLGDNAETCLEGKVVLREVGIESYHHLPCLNTDPAFIRFLAEVVGKEG